MKTILISSFHPLVSRNIFNSGLLDKLSLNNRVVILVPDFKKNYFVKEYSGSNVIIEGIEKKLSKKNLFFRKLFLFIAPTKTLRIKHRAEILVNKNFLYFIGHFLVPVLFGRCKFFINFLRFFDYYLSRRQLFYVLFNKYHPNLIFSTDIQSDFDVNLLQEAKRAGIKTIGMVRSWDNLTAKGILRIITDHFIVNNEIIKAEAMKYNGIAGENISVIGIPHYDNYLKPKVLLKKDFFAQLGFNLDKKFILYAPIGNRYINNNGIDRIVLGILSQLDVNILVRLPPGDYVSLDGFFSKKARVYFNQPGVRYWKGGLKTNEISKDDDRFLINALYYSDVIVGGPSTICIDAAVFNKPIILIHFNDKKRKYFNSISRYYDYNHFQPIIKSKGVKFANSRREFLEFVAVYLKDPAEDQDGRKRIVRDQVCLFDGKSTQRLANILLSYLTK